jgi:hypothetical protein
MSISQISETIYFFNFFFLKRFGIKQVMLILLSWVLRFGLFAYKTLEMDYG